MSTEVTGTLVWYYAICPREAWLMAHEMEPEREFDLLAEGRLNQEAHYKRVTKELALPRIRLDQVRREGDRLIVSEVKKSSRFLPATRLQLGYYLWRLDKEGIDVAGEILVPEERKREVVELTEELKAEVEKTVADIEALIRKAAPPPARKIPFCKKCAYAEFCWS
ncbi:MAG: CRISPR-associated protein Cas4 [Actinobacteria bacterium]|nr:MAG: CRISPR-associated protein Cas4 [Actinomycetota bacterium]